MKYRQSWLQSSGISCKWAILQNRCTISSSDKFTIMHSNSLIHQEWLINRSTMLPICISHTTCIQTHCNDIKPLDLHLTPATQWAAITMIFHVNMTSSSLFHQSFHILRLPPAWSVTSRHFHLPPTYEDHIVTLDVSLDKNISIQLTSPSELFVSGNT